MSFLSNRLTPWIDPRIFAVRVAQVESYLLRHGWKRRPSPRPQLLFFEGPQADDGEPILQPVPSAERGSDYVQRIVEVITNLALIEDRYAVEVLNEILQSVPGELSPSPVTPDGTNRAGASGLPEPKPA
jgi:hypothetical protein